MVNVNYLILIPILWKRKTFMTGMFIVLSSKTLNFRSNLFLFKNYYHLSPGLSLIYSAF